MTTMINSFLNVSWLECGHIRIDKYLFDMADLVKEVEEDSHVRFSTLQVAKVWELWNNPDDIIRWNTPDPSWHSPSSENDLRVGGRFKNRMEAKDGSFGFDFEGVYDSVILNKEITYTMGDGRQATIIFNEKAGKPTWQPLLILKQKTIQNFKNKDGKRS